METTTDETDLGARHTEGLTGGRAAAMNVLKGPEKVPGVPALHRSPVKGYKVTTEASYQEPHVTSTRTASVEAMENR